MSTEQLMDSPERSALGLTLGPLASGPSSEPTPTQRRQGSQNVSEHDSMSVNTSVDIKYSEESPSSTGGDITVEPR
jgi:hypothetical protein